MVSRFREMPTIRFIGFPYSYIGRVGLMGEPGGEGGADFGSLCSPDLTQESRLNISWFRQQTFRLKSLGFG